MRRKSLLSVAMLSVLLATSACTAGTSAVGSFPRPAGSAGAAFTGAGAGGSSSAGAGSGKGPQIGVSQWNAAEAAKTANTEATAAAPAARSKPAAAEVRSVEGNAGAAAKAGAAQSAAAKGASAAIAEKASKTTAAKKAAKAAAAAKADAAKKIAVPVPAKTPPVGAHGLKHVTPIPVDPKGAPAPLQSASPEKTDRKALNVPPGTRFHLPDAFSYFEVGDTCGDGDHHGDRSCHDGHDAHGTDSTPSVDAWLDGPSLDGDGSNG